MGNKFLFYLGMVMTFAPVSVILLAMLISGFQNKPIETLISTGIIILLIGGVILMVKNR